jgi:hypothetical protein
MGPLLADVFTTIGGVFIGLCVVLYVIDKIARIRKGKRQKR